MESVCIICEDEVVLENGVWTHVDNHGTYVVAGWRIVDNDGNVTEDGTHCATV